MLIKQSLRWEKDSLIIIDQTQLPLNEVELKLETLYQVISAIKELSIRGAPAIGITAGYGVVVALRSSNIGFHEIKRKLEKTRPTAVNLAWALKRMEKIFINCKNKNNDDTISALLLEAKKIHKEDRDMCEKIGERMNSLIPEPANIMTICNTGFLATGGIGTAFAGIVKAHEAGKNVHVYVTETRPLLQGARLTAWELAKLNIPATLITDNMAAHVMKNKKIDLIVAGADRIAKNGDTANKIGTYSLAVLAKFHKIPFYIVAPSSTVDLETKSGNEIIIEERNANEVKRIREITIAPQEINAYNPAFDITPHSFIRSIITEKGIISDMKKLKNQIIRS